MRRDRVIYEMRRAGSTFTEIGRELGLHRVTVRAAYHGEYGRRMAGFDGMRYQQEVLGEIARWAKT